MEEKPAPDNEPTTSAPPAEPASRVAARRFAGLLEFACVAMGIAPPTAKGDPFTYGLETHEDGHTSLYYPHFALFRFWKIDSKEGDADTNLIQAIYDPVNPSPHDPGFAPVIQSAEDMAKFANDVISLLIKARVTPAASLWRLYDATGGAEAQTLPVAFTIQITPAPAPVETVNVNTVPIVTSCEVFRVDTPGIILQTDAGTTFTVKSVGIGPRYSARKMSATKELVLREGTDLQDEDGNHWVTLRTLDGIPEHFKPTTFKIQGNELRVIAGEYAPPPPADLHPFNPDPLTFAEVTAAVEVITRTLSLPGRDWLKIKGLVTVNPDASRTIIEVDRLHRQSVRLLEVAALISTARSDAYNPLSVESADRAITEAYGALKVLCTDFTATPISAEPAPDAPASGGLNTVRIDVPGTQVLTDAGEPYTVKSLGKGEFFNARLTGDKAIAQIGLYEGTELQDTRRETWAVVQSIVGLPDDSLVRHLHIHGNVINLTRRATPPAGSVSRETSDAPAPEATDEQPAPPFVSQSYLSDWLEQWELTKAEVVKIIVEDIGVDEEQASQMFDKDPGAFAGLVASDKKEREPLDVEPLESVVRIVARKLALPNDAVRAWAQDNPKPARRVLRTYGDFRERRANLTIAENTFNHAKAAWDNEALSHKLTHSLMPYLDKDKGPLSPDEVARVVSVFINHGAFDRAAVTHWAECNPIKARALINLLDIAGMEEREYLSGKTVNRDYSPRDGIREIIGNTGLKIQPPPVVMAGTFKGAGEAGEARAATEADPARVEADEAAIEMLVTNFTYERWEATEWVRAHPLEADALVSRQEVGGEPLDIADRGAIIKVLEDTLNVAPEVSREWADKHPTAARVVLSHAAAERVARNAKEETAAAYHTARAALDQYLISPELVLLRKQTGAVSDPTKRAALTADTAPPPSPDAEDPYLKRAVETPRGQELAALFSESAISEEQYKSDIQQVAAGLRIADDTNQRRDGAEMGGNYTFGGNVRYAPKEEDVPTSVDLSADLFESCFGVAPRPGPFVLEADMLRLANRVITDFQAGEMTEETNTLCAAMLKKIDAHSDPTARKYYGRLLRFLTEEHRKAIEHAGGISLTPEQITGLNSTLKFAYEHLDSLRKEQGTVSRETVPAPAQPAPPAQPWNTSAACFRQALGLDPSGDVLMPWERDVARLINDLEIDRASYHDAPADGPLFRRLRETLTALYETKDPVHSKLADGLYNYVTRFLVASDVEALGNNWKLSTVKADNP